MVANNLNLETKIGYQMEDSMHSMWESVFSSNLTLSIAENHMELQDHKKNTVDKMINNINTSDNHTVPKSQEPNSEKTSTTRVNRKMTFDTTKNKMRNIKECTNIKTRPSIRPTKGRPSVKQTKTRAGVEKRAKTINDKCAESSDRNPGGTQ